MANFKKIGGAFFRETDTGELYAVSDPDTLKGLSKGQLPYNSVENSRGLSFAGQTTSPAPETKPATTSATGSADIGSIIKQKLIGALTNYKGVTNTDELEQKRQGLLRKQLLSAPYSTEGESTMTGSQKLSLLRSRGSEFDPEIKSIEEQILKAKQGDSDSLSFIQKLSSLAKDTGVIGTEKRDTSLTEVDGKRVLVDNQTGEIIKDLGTAKQDSISGLTPQQTTTFNAIVDKYNKSPLVVAKDRTVVMDSVLKNLDKNKTDPSLQLSFIYSFIQLLDTYQSAVREGEIGLMKGTQGLADKIRNYPNKIAKGTILSESVVSNYLNTANTLVNSIKEAANAKKNQFGSQAKVSGLERAWSDYTSAIEIGSGETKIVNGVVYKKVEGGWQKQ